MLYSVRNVTSRLVNYYGYQNAKMPGQKKISSFFASTGHKKTTRQKRPAELIEGGVPNKKPHNEVPDDSSKPSNPISFSHPAFKSLGLDTIGDSWRIALSKEFQKDYFIKLGKFIGSERSSSTVYPPVNEVFSWTRLCDIADVKVVVLGQDPYHGVNQAHGLCFSVKQPVRPPPSLVNIYKELGNDIEGFVHPGHGDLTGWAKQGVLLLNAVLTVRAHCANSHKDKGWETFTNAVIKYINENCTGIVFLLWGAYAQKKGAFIDKSKHHILRSVHPSPLSAHRGFLGCKHFSKTNLLLNRQNDCEIDWCAIVNKD